MKIIPLSEGSFTVDGSKQFIPYHRHDELQHKERGSLLVEIQPFIIITKKDIILLDTGLGMNDDNGHFLLYKNIKNAGIDPGDITKVLISHLHKDHSGGLLNPFTHTISFDNATIYVQKRELYYAREKGSPSYSRSITDVLESAQNLELQDNDAGFIDGYIQYEVTYAHSKYHQVFWINDDDEIVFYGADDVSQYSQLKRPFSAKYDYDGKRAMELREKWRAQGTQENWSFLFYHDTNKPVLDCK